MNIMDILVMGLLLLYFLSGMYRGFLPSLLNLGGFFAAWVGSLLGYRLIAKRMLASEFISSFQFYVEGAEKVNDYEAARLAVSSLSKADISSIMSNAKLPSFFSRADRIQPQAAGVRGHGSDHGRRIFQYEHLLPDLEHHFLHLAVLPAEMPVHIADQCLLLLHSAPAAQAL